MFALCEMAINGGLIERVINEMGRGLGMPRPAQHAQWPYI
jgi:hypothetical protein